MGADVRQAIERATLAWQRRWASETPDEPPEMHRYRVTFTCDAETFETVKGVLKGFCLSGTVYRVVDDEL